MMLLVKNLIKTDNQLYFIFHVFSAPLVKAPAQSVNYEELINCVPREDLYPMHDSINLLSTCPWIINKEVGMLSLKF